MDVVDFPPRIQRSTTTLGTKKQSHVHTPHITYDRAGHSTYILSTFNIQQPTSSSCSPALPTGMPSVSYPGGGRHQTGCTPGCLPRQSGSAGRSVRYSLRIPCDVQRHPDCHPGPRSWARKTPGHHEPMPFRLAEPLTVVHKPSCSMAYPSKINESSTTMCN